MSKTIIRIQSEWNAGHHYLDNVDYDLPGWATLPEEFREVWEANKPFVKLFCNAAGEIVRMYPTQELTEDDCPDLLQTKINGLKMELDNTDYKIIKCTEYQLAGKELPYDVPTLHEERQKLRDDIGDLQEKLDRAKARQEAEYAAYGAEMAEIEA